MELLLDRVFVGRASERAYSRNKRRFDRAQVARGPHVNVTAADLVLNGQWWSERALARPAHPDRRLDDGLNRRQHIILGTGESTESFFLGRILSYAKLSRGM